MGETSTVRVPRGWVFLVMGASVLGATIAAVAMVNWLGPRLAHNDTHKQSQAPVHTGSEEKPANREAPHTEPAANSPPHNAPPVKPPPDNTSGPPKEEPPPPPPEDPPAWKRNHIVALLDGAEFKVRVPGGEWAEGTAAAQLAEGMRIKVARGRLVLNIFDARVTCSQGCELAITACTKRGIIDLRDGRVLVNGRLEVRLPQGALALEWGGAAFLAAPGTSEAQVSEGSMAYAEGSEWRRLKGPVEVFVGSSVQHRELDSARAAALEEELRPSRDVLLRWDFEGAQLPCALGTRVAPGFRGSAGALGSSIEFSAIGDDGQVRFTPAGNSRIRFRVKTNAPWIRISFVTGTGRDAPTCSYMEHEHELNEWSGYYEFALFADNNGQNKSAEVFAGKVCHSLQFRMRFEDGSEVLPSERYLIIDDVEIYTPK